MKTQTKLNTVIYNLWTVHKNPKKIKFYKITVHMHKTKLSECNNKDYRQKSIILQA